MLNYTVLPSGIIDWFHHCSIVLEFSLALGFDHEPSAAALMSAEGWLVQVNHCVFLQFACDPRTSSREEGGVLVTCVLSLRVFFRPMHAAWTHFYTFIQGHEKPSDCL